MKNPASKRDAYQSRERQRPAHCASALHGPVARAPGSENPCATLHRDEDGSVMLEHALLLAAFTLPMYLVLGAGIKAIGTYYGMLTFFGSIPFS